MNNKNEIVIGDESVIVQKPIISFPEYESLLEQAKIIAENVRAMDVTPDNIKESKKILASVNKSIKSLNDKRIQAKKTILEPYDELEKQVKEIEKIVKDADTLVRDQVKALEEAEREEKKDEIYNIWSMRIDQYEFAKVMLFDDFLTPQHLNKTVTIKKVEDEMVEFLEKSERDLKALSNNDNFEVLVKDYRETKDLALVMVLDEQRKEEQKKVKEQLKDIDIESFVFKVFNRKDKKLVEMLLKENEIEYKEI